MEITVLPNPPAIATISSRDNVFCDVASINTTITISSNTTGQNNFQWFDANGAIPNQKSTSLNVTPSMGPGTYTFEATNPNGCVSISNPIQIFVNPCGGTGSCTITETVTNTSSLTACGEITFSGTHTGSSNGEFYTVLGPSSNNYSINGNILTGKPGSYTIAYNVKYNCQQGTGEGIITDIKNVVIPYEPDFSYVVECTPSNTFNIDIIDESIFYAPVTSQQVNFFYRSLPGGVYQPITYYPILGNFEISNLSPGSYEFKQEVDGVYNGVAQTTCVQEFTVSLQGVNPTTVIDILNPIYCHNTAVGFDLDPGLITGSTVLWDFDDNGAQNTMDVTSRVFTTPDETYDVTATVTNELGCVSEFTTPVTIPEECFFGDITSSPSPAEVCQNETVDITYEGPIDNCPVDEYIWMDGNTPVPGAPHGATLTVSSTGFYWVKVVSQDGCEHSSPTQIKPVFKTLPNVKLIGESTVCVDADMIYNVSTNASTIEWFVDGTPYSQFDDLTEADFTGQLSTGNYTVSVEVTATNGCTNTATMDITIADVLSNISFNTSFQCTPYQVEIEAITTPSNPNITYNWSNGASTQSISVPDGGPYRVTASLGGCSISKQVDIPKNPEDYLWIYPSGCYTDCYAEKDEQYGYLIGPTLPLPSWSWNESGNPIQTGFGSYQTPFYLLGNGSYSSTINTGHCEMESDPLDFALERCEKCEIEDVKIEKVYQNNTPYCSFTYHVMIYSSASVPFSATIFDDFNNVSIIPSTFTLNPGPNYLTFTVIPQNPFTFGVTDWTIQGSIFNDNHYMLCTYGLRVEVPKCDNSTYYSKKIKVGDSSELDVEEILNVYPNPAKETATVYYEISSEGGDLEVYDLSGRSVAKQKVNSAKGEVPLNTGKYQAGVYIVVLRQSNGYTMQQKLVIE